MRGIFRTNKPIVFFAVLLLAIITGCAHYSLVKASKNVEIGKAFTVSTSVDWSKSQLYGIETWTINGPQLERLMFFDGVKNGKPLFEVKRQDEKKMPIYKSSMSSIEIKELFEATLARNGAYKITTENFKPSKFGVLQGFKFEFTYATKNGLRYKGLVLGAKEKERLIAIMYIGTALYHYSDSLDEVENIISSVKIY